MHPFFAALYTELLKIRARPRSIIGFVVITAIIVLIQLAFYADGSAYIGFITQQFESSFYIQGTVLNGNLICFIILQTLIIHVPLLIALVTGDLVSGEAAMGTLRLLMSKPIARSQIIMAKFCAGAIYTGGLLFWLGFLALGNSLLLFGTGDLIVLGSDGFNVLQQQDVLWRFFAALGVAYIALLLICALSLLLSVFSENSIGPIVSTMAIIILFTIIGTLEVPLFDNVRPFLFTTHMATWRSFFESSLPVNQIIVSVTVLLAHILVLLSAALYCFNKKDILS